MKGVGIDIIESERIKKLIATKSFKEKIFLPKEIEYCEKFDLKEERYAGAFACKEAVMKACKTAGKFFNEIEITHQDNGAPKILLHGNMKKQFDETKIEVSISHIKTVGIAIAYLND